jgi:fatty-acyl-CoA synthase
MPPAEGRRSNGMGTAQSHGPLEQGGGAGMPASRTIPDLLDELARRFPDREAVVGSGARYTYRQLRLEVRRVARALHGLGVRRGDKVAILMGNRPEWIIADLAITLLGGVVVGVNTWATARELEYVLAHSDTKILITVARFLNHDYRSALHELEPLAERLPVLERIICAGDETPADWLRYADLGALAGKTPEAAIDAARRAVSPADVAYLLYTSGSTAMPKGVLLQHYALIENMWHIGERQHVTERDRLWLAVSLFWGLGCENALFNALTHAGCVVLQEYFDASAALRLIEEERCTLFYGTPNMGQALYEHPERSRRALGSLRGGATIGTPEQIRRVIDLGAREVCNIYGLTETYGNCNVTDAADPLEKRLASVGLPLPGVDQRIVDAATGAVLPPGGVGEIRVKGYVTLGYYKDAERTAESFDEHGYFRTGDLGWADADGYLYFRGRIKEMVKTGGINVAPAEVEEILMSHPGVHLAFVIGVRDELRDEALAAVIVAKPQARLAADELARFCRQSLAAYKVPRLFRVVVERELPLTSTGKVQKSRLAETFFADSTPESPSPR